MGNLLTKPKTIKTTEKGEGNGLKFGVSSMQGWRAEMEDAHCALISLNDLKDWSYFAVFDGHAGTFVSRHCATKLLDSILESQEFKNNVTSEELTDEQIELAKQGIRNGFLKLDVDMKVLPELNSGEKSGSTAVCAIISSKHIFFANCGDSRAVLSSAEQVKFITDDHKPFNQAEKERIQNAGGSVMIQRVNGSLAVSRALGDYEYKQCKDKDACEQLVSPEPEINVINRNNEEDEFLILACDGVWDVINNDDLCSFVRHQLQIETNLDLICSSIIDTCLYRGSLDNMTIILVVLPGAPQFDEEKKKLDKELDDFISQKIDDYILENPKASFENVLCYLKEKQLNNLPPGVGLDAKKHLIRETYTNMTGKYAYYCD